MTKKPYVPQHISRWYETVNYLGENFDGYYVASWRLLRCGPTERANHDYIKAHLLDSVPSDQSHLIQVCHFSDDVYTSRFYVLVHESCEKALRMADMFAKRVKAKGSLDPEGERAQDLKGIKNAWRSAKLRAKIRMCSEAGISIFVARREQFPEGIDGLRIYQSMNEVDVQAQELADE
jgi:hypothetical protein